MFKSKLFRVLLVVMLFITCLMVAAPVFAQDGGEDVVIVPNGSVFGTQWDPVVVVVVGVTFAALLLALFIGLTILLREAIKALGVSVPEGVFERVIEKVTEGITGAIEQLLADLQQSASETETPIDDLVLQVGRIPIDELVKIARGRGLTVITPQVSQPDTKEIPEQEIRASSLRNDATH